MSDEARGGNLLGYISGFCFCWRMGLAQFMTQRRRATMLKMEPKKKKVKNKQNTQKIHRIFNSNHFANPTGAISEAQHVQRRICNLYPAVTSWSERRAQVLEARMQEKTLLNDDFNWQFVAHDQRKLLPRDLVWRGREHSLPRFTWVVSEQAFTALFRPF